MANIEAAINKQSMVERLLAFIHQIAQNTSYSYINLFSIRKGLQSICNKKKNKTYFLVNNQNNSNTNLTFGRNYKLADTKLARTHLYSGLLQAIYQAYRE